MKVKTTSAMLAAAAAVALALAGCGSSSRSTTASNVARPAVASASVGSVTNGNASTGTTHHARQTSASSSVDPGEASVSAVSNPSSGSGAVTTQSSPAATTQPSPVASTKPKAAATTKSKPAPTTRSMPVATTKAKAPPITNTATATTSTPAATTPLPADTTPTNVPDPTAPDAGMPPTAQVSGPTPIDCLKIANLVNVQADQQGVWQGQWDLNGDEVYVEGPYTSHTGAEQSAQSLAGVELEAAGGLYAVSAGLTSQLSFQVNAVANCLAQATGKGTDSF